MNDSREDKHVYFNFLGMRTIKTVIVVFICLMISLIRDTSPLYSVFAAIICMKADQRSSLEAGIDRIMGTLIGGIYAYLTISAARYLGLEIPGFIFYTFTSLMIIPVVYTNLLLKSDASVTISCVVLFSVAIGYATDVAPLFVVVDRMLETIIGIVVSILINRVL